LVGCVVEKLVPSESRMRATVWYCCCSLNPGRWFLAAEVSGFDNPTAGQLALEIGVPLLDLRIAQSLK